MTEKIARLIWQVLVEECGATTVEDSGHGWLSFWSYMQRREHHYEFRFMGKLGFGGKFYRQHGYRPDRWYRVDCYHEDVTPERTAMIDSANARLEIIGLAEQEHLACACSGIEPHMTMLWAARWATIDAELAEHEGDWDAR